MRLPLRLSVITLFLTCLVSIALGIYVKWWVQQDPVDHPLSLDEIKIYAEGLQEFPESDDNDWTDPHFNTYDKSRDLTITQKVFKAIYLLKEPSWSPKFLARNLRELTKLNKERGFSQGFKTFLHIKTNAKTRVFVFGDLHGAFHSLLRDLGYLKEQELIDNSLKLSPNVYMIFNGDLIDRSPHSIDTLILTTLLLKANPDQVHYVAGKHERNSHWRDFGLKRELVARGYHYSQQSVPFKNEVNDFFQTLPEAVYLSSNDSSLDVIRISFNDHLNLSYNEELISPAFLEQTQGVKAYHLLPDQSSETQINVRAVVKTEEWRISNKVKNGIGLLNQDHGATAWASVSSPISAHKTFLNIYEDSFIEIAMADSVVNSLIFSHYQDIRTMNGFKKTEPKNIIFGGAPTAQKKSQSLKIASSMSLIRGVPTLGKQALRGLNLAVNQFNLNYDESHDHKLNIRLFVDNDDYNPQKARQNVVEHLEEGIETFLLPTGTPTVMSFMDLVKKEKISVFFPITGSAALRKEEYKNIIHIRPSYEQEVKALINTLVKDFGALKFAIFYQDDSYGTGPYLEALKQLKNYGINEVTSLPHARGTVSFENQVKALKLSQPDALALFATANASEEFIRQLGIDSLSNTQVFGISFVGELTLRRFTERLGINLMLASPVPNPNTFNEKIGQLYRQAMDEEGKDYDVFSFEAFIAASFLFHALEQSYSKASPLNTRALMRQVESYGQKDFMGFPMKFNSKTRSLGQYIWIESKANSEWKRHPIE